MHGRPEVAPGARGPKRSLKREVGAHACARVCVQVDVWAVDRLGEAAVWWVNAWGGWVGKVAHRTKVARIPVEAAQRAATARDGMGGRQQAAAVAWGASCPWSGEWGVEGSCRVLWRRASAELFNSFVWRYILVGSLYTRRQRSAVPGRSWRGGLAASPLCSIHVWYARRVTR